MQAIAELWKRNARHSPDALAVIFEDRQLTYRELYSRACRLGSALSQLGVQRQDRVSMLAMNSLEWMEFYAACHLSGFIAGTVNFRLVPPEIAYILKDSSPKVVIFEEQYADAVASIKSQLPSVEYYVCIGRAPEWAQSYDALISSGSGKLPPDAYTPEDYAHLIYTSGTTGKPKGALRTQNCEYLLAQSAAVDLGASPDDRMLLVMPMFHIGAIAFTIAMLYVGGSVVIQRRFEPRETLEALARHKATLSLFAPTMVQMLLDVPEVREFDLSNLRTITYSAAPMPPSVLRRGIELLGPVFVNMYGGTEMGPATTLHKRRHVLDGPPDEIKRLNSLGQAFAGVDLRIFDDHGAECPPDVIGEIVLRGKSVMSAYWNNHAATIEALRGGWYHTGDMGSLDEQGCLYLVDRKKDMIISGGENVYCREVEDALMEHKGVADAAVIGVPDKKWGEAVKAIVIRSAGSKVTEQELIAHCRSLIAGYKAPRSIDFVTELPRLPSGKVSKVELRKLFIQPTA